MKKLVALLSVIVVSLSLFNPSSSAAPLDLFTQGEGYQQGKYDKEAVQPIGLNWDRNSRYEGASKDISLKWKYDMPDTNHSALVIDKNGTIFVTSYVVNASVNYQLTAISQDGKEKWTFKTNDDLLYSSPVINEQGNLLISVKGSLVEFDADTGERTIITKPVETTISSEPVIDENGSIYALSIGPVSRLNAYNSDGSNKWKVSIPRGANGHISLSKDGTLYFKAGVNNSTCLYAYNSVDGENKWKFPIPNGGSSTTAPTIGSDGTVYTVDNNGVIFAINPDGTLKWSYKTPIKGSSFGRLFEPVVGRDGTIYASNGYNNLYALNKDGTLQWVYTSSEIKQAPIIDKNNIVYFANSDELIALNHDGTKRWSYPIKTAYFSAMAIGSDGTIYLQDWNGPLVAIGGKSPESHTTENGLIGEYYNNEDFTDKKFDRKDANIDFDWGLGSPDERIEPQTYSIRWTGKIKPSFSDIYWFSTQSDDGVRLWINDELVIDNWNLDDGSTKKFGSIRLEADQKYDFKLEYFNGTNHGKIQLKWGSELHAEEVIPSSAFYTN